MATFGALIQDRIGTFTNTDLIDHTLTEGARIIVDKLADERDSRLDLYATEKTDSGSGIDVTGGRVIKAHKSNYRAMNVESDNAARYSLAGSIYKATATDPIWYLLKTKAYIIPSGGTALWVAYPTVANTDSAISNFPPQGYPAIVLYSSIAAQMSIISTLIATTMAAIAWSAPSAIATPSAPSFTWTDAVIGTYTATTLGVTATVPTYTKPTQTFDVTQLETFLETNVDVEPAQVQLGRLKHEIEEYSLDIQNELNEFNKEDKAYQGKITQEIKQAELTQNQILKLAEDTTELNKFNELQTLAEQVQEYQAVLGKHQSDVANFAAQVNSEASRIQGLIQQYTSMYTAHFQLLKELKEEYNRVIAIL